MIELQKLTLRPGESEKKLRKLTEKALRLQPEEILTFEIAKKSLDARKKRDIHYVYAVHLKLPPGIAMPRCSSPMPMKFPRLRCRSAR